MPHPIFAPTFFANNLDSAVRRIQVAADTLVQRGKLITQPLYSGHFGMNLHAAVSEQEMKTCKIQNFDLSETEKPYIPLPAFLVHTGLLIAQIGFVFRDIVNLGLSLLTFSPTHISNALATLVLDTLSVMIKFFTIELALVSFITRPLMSLNNFAFNEGYNHASLTIEEDCKHCEDGKLESLIVNSFG